LKENHTMMHARFRALILATAFLAGCASVKKTTEGWWGDLTSSGSGASGQPQGGSVYYAASDGLVMRASASGSASIVGRLTQYQRVVRTQLVNGWAYVTTDGGLSGWVDNAQLVWRVPSAAGAPATGAEPASADTTAAPAPVATSAPADVPAEPAGAAPAPTAEPSPAPTAPPDAPPPAPSPAPVAAPQPTAQRNQPSPDMFDPF
jgi:hypothetical protein